MAGQTPTETTPLNKTVKKDAKKDAPPLKPILAAVPEGLRPYLELIRLEKVLVSHYCRNSIFIRRVAHWDHPDVLAVRYALGIFQSRLH
jgi:hypothetical protein